MFEILRLRWLDVGGAGAFGFIEAEPLQSAVSTRLLDTAGDVIEVSEVRFVRGGHGAAITEQFWPEIARFILQGTVPSRHPVARKEEVQLLFRCAPVFTSIGLAPAAVLLALPLLVAVTATGLAIAHGTPLSLAITWTLVAVSASLVVSWFAGRFLRMW